MEDATRLASLETRLLPDLRISLRRRAQLDRARALGVTQIPAQAVRPRRAIGREFVDEATFGAGDRDGHRPRVFQEVLQVRSCREVANDFARRAAARCRRIDGRAVAAAAKSSSAASALPALPGAGVRASLPCASGCLRASAAACLRASAVTPASIGRAASRRLLCALTTAKTTAAAKADRRIHKTGRA